MGEGGNPLTNTNKQTHMYVLRRDCVPEQTPRVSCVGRLHFNENKSLSKHIGGRWADVGHH